jgi:hypothetical protein
MVEATLFFSSPTLSQRLLLTGLRLLARSLSQPIRKGRPLVRSRRRRSLRNCYEEGRGDPEDQEGKGGCSRGAVHSNFSARPISPIVAFGKRYQYSWREDGHRSPVELQANSRRVQPVDLSS